MKKVCILMGSPRLNGNTAELLKPFVTRLKGSECYVEYITLHDKDIKSCKGCYVCQHVPGKFGCVLEDDVHAIMDAIISADCVVFATPIYSWYCTTPMKALLDRHFGLNKFYGKAPRESLWQGKKVAIVATHGYDGNTLANLLKQASSDCANTPNWTILVCTPLVTRIIWLHSKRMKPSQGLWLLQMKSLPYSALINKNRYAYTIRHFR